MKKEKAEVESSGTVLYKKLMALVDPTGAIGSADSDVRMQMRELVFRLVGAGYGRIRVLSVKRTLMRQQELYGHGRTEEDLRKAGVPECYASPGEHKITWVAPSNSKHVMGKAIDIDIRMYTKSTWPVIGAIGQSLGFKWGGNWKVRDYGHFEV